MKLVRPVKTRASLIAPSTASVPLLMKKEYCRSPGVISPSSSASAPRSGSSSSCEDSGMRCELVGHRLDDLGMPDAGAVDAVAAQAVDVRAPGEVLEGRALAGPLEGRALAHLDDRLAVLEVAAVVIEGKVVDGVVLDLVLLLLRELLGGDDVEPAAATRAMSSCVSMRDPVPVSASGGSGRPCQARRGRREAALRVSDAEEVPAAYASACSSTSSPSCSSASVTTSGIRVRMMLPWVPAATQEQAALVGLLDDAVGAVLVGLLRRLVLDELERPHGAEAARVADEGESLDERRGSAPRRPRPIASARSGIRFVLEEARRRPAPRRTRPGCRRTCRRARRPARCP